MTPKAANLGLVHTLAILLTASPLMFVAHAQTTTATGSIEGTVSDPSGEW